MIDVEEITRMIRESPVEAALTLLHQTELLSNDLEQCKLELVAIHHLAKSLEEKADIATWPLILQRLTRVPIYRRHQIEIAYAFLESGPRVIAHRGIQTEVRPPREDVSMVEIDVQMDPERRELVVRHDVYHNPLQRALSLDDVLHEWQYDTPLLLDVKGITRHPETVDALVHLLERHDRLTYPCITFNVPFLERIANEHRHKLANYGLITANVDPSHVGRVLRRTYANLLVVEANACSHEIVDEIRAIVPWRIQVYVYTVNDVYHLQAARESGADAIIHDVPTE